MNQEQEEADKDFAKLSDLLNSMHGVPVRSSGEAIMAIDFVFEDSHGCMISLHSDTGDNDSTYAWLLKSARDYIASNARAVTQALG